MNKKVIHKIVYIYIFTQYVFPVLKKNRPCFDEGGRFVLEHGHFGISWTAMPCFLRYGGSVGNLQTIIFTVYTLSLGLTSEWPGIYYCMQIEFHWNKATRRLAIRVRAWESEQTQLSVFWIDCEWLESSRDGLPICVKLWVETHHNLIDQSYVHIICICSMHLPLLITTELANLPMNR